MLSMSLYANITFIRILLMKGLLFCGDRIDVTLGNEALGCYNYESYCITRRISTGYKIMFALYIAYLFIRQETKV